MRFTLQFIPEKNTVHSQPLLSVYLDVTKYIQHMLHTRDYYRSKLVTRERFPNLPIYLSYTFTFSAWFLLLWRNKTYVLQCIYFKRKCLIFCVVNCFTFSFLFLFSDQDQVHDWTVWQLESSKWTVQFLFLTRDLHIRFGNNHSLLSNF